MSCLFIALGKLLNIDSTKLRLDICNFIEKNSDKKWNGTTIEDWIKYAAGDRYQNITKYTHEMRNLGEWGGAPEIAICCIINNVDIEVLNLRDKTQNMLFNDEDNIKIIKNKSSIQKNRILAPISIQTLEIPNFQKIPMLPNKHPLKKKYNEYYSHRLDIIRLEQERLTKLNLENTIDNTLNSSTEIIYNNHISERPTLVISWSGNHYEPITIKNPRPL